MIIRFENLDNPSYSAQFTFDNNGFNCAEYDYSDFVDVVDPDFSTENSFTDFISKTYFDIFTDDFVSAVLFDNYSHFGSRWHSFKVSFNSGDYSYGEGFNSWDQNNFDSLNQCSCRATIDCREYNDCPDNLYSDFVVDSWTSSKCMKISEYDVNNDCLKISFYNFLDFNINDSVPCYYKGFLPTISFVEPSINYPHFKIFAYDFDNFSGEDCKYSLFLHILNTNSDNEREIKTVKVGSFGVYQGNFYFENFYSNKVFNFVERYFDFYTFFNTNTIDNVSDFMKSNYNDFQDVNINSFGNIFVFELKKEDYSGVYMSALDCECLTSAINSLNSHIDNFNKSFSEAFNKVPVSGQLVSGSGSVFKSNDSDNHDYYYLIDNKGKSCDYPLNVNLCPFTFSEVPVRINSIPGLDVDIDTMPTSRLVTHVNSAVDISCICSELDDIDKGLVAEFASLGLSLTAIKTAVDGVAAKFVTGCETSIASAFSEAFNLTNCHGSVFKANDDDWSDDDTLAGILYKVLDYSYLQGDSSRYSPFYSNYTNSGRLFTVGFGALIGRAFFSGAPSGSSSSVFNFNPVTVNSISGVLKKAFFTNDNASAPDKPFSVFSCESDNFRKILYHGCDGSNPCSIKFCDNILPVNVVNQSNNPVKIEMEPTSSINVNVESAPSDPANIYINADGKTFLNNNNFK